MWVAALQGGGPPPCRPVTCTYGAPWGTWTPNPLIRTTQLSTVVGSCGNLCATTRSTILTTGRLWSVVVVCRQRMWRKMCVVATSHPPGTGGATGSAGLFVWGPLPGERCGRSIRTALPAEALSLARPLANRGRFHYRGRWMVEKVRPLSSRCADVASARVRALVTRRTSLTRRRL